MRSRFFGPGATLGGGTVYRSNATYAAAVLAESSLVSYWRLGETTGTQAGDSKGVNTGTYTGGFTLNQVSPVKDGNPSVALNGSSGYVNVPHHASLAITGDLTLEAWVFPTDYVNYNQVVAKTSAAGEAASYDLRLEIGGGRAQLSLGNGVAVSTLSNSTINPPTGAWSHVAVTVSGTTVTFFLNGVSSAGGTNAAARADTGLPLRIGQRGDLNAATYFKGSIDDVAVYNAALSPTRIAAHYAAA